MRRVLMLFLATAAGVVAGLIDAAAGAEEPVVDLMWSSFSPTSGGPRQSDTRATPRQDALPRPPRIRQCRPDHGRSACPVCSPYRATLMTGRYPVKHGVFVNDVCSAAKPSRSRRPSPVPDIRPRTSANGTWTGMDAQTSSRRSVAGLRVLAGV